MPGFLPALFHVSIFVFFTIVKKTQHSYTTNLENNIWFVAVLIFKMGCGDHDSNYGTLLILSASLETKQL